MMVHVVRLIFQAPKPGISSSHDCQVMDLNEDTHVVRLDADHGFWFVLLM